MGAKADAGAEAALSTDRIRELLRYDPSTGVFTWRRSRTGQPKAGSVAGHTTNHGRRAVTVDGRRFLSARLAWLYMTGAWPDGLVDHENTLSDDDRWENLRIATKSQNMVNRGAARNSKTGVKGVSKALGCDRWLACICVNYKRIYLGCFKTIPEAKAAYDAAALKYFGEFARAA